MKRFELWRQEKGSLLYDIQQDQNLEDLDEMKIGSLFKTLFKKIVGPIKSLFNLSRYRFGQSRKIDVKIPIPSNLAETKSNQKNNGTQVEMLSGMFLAKELESLGFDVDLRLENKPTTPVKLNREIETLQKRIEGNNLDGISDPKKLNKIKKSNSKQLAKRKNYAIATAKNLAKVVQRDLTDYPGMFTVIIDSAGYAGEGSTKADIHIEYEVKKMTEGEVLPELKKYAISHKYNWEQSMGTQVNSVYGLIYSIVTGQSAKVGTSTVNKIVEPILIKEFGKDALEDMERLKGLWGHKDKRVSGRSGGKSKETEYKVLDPEAQKDFLSLQNKFYKFAAELIEQNPLNMLKLIGIEEGVDHFMVVFNKSTKRYDTYSSIDSKKYKQFVHKMYNEEFRKEVNCKARVSGQGVIDFEYFWRGNSIYKTQVTAQETNIGKSKSIVQGISINDMDDGVTSHDAEFGAQIPKDLIAIDTTPKKGQSKTGIERIDTKRVTQKRATEMWSKKAIQLVKSAGKSDKGLRGRLMANKEKSIALIMGGLSPKNAIEHALGE